MKIKATFSILLGLIVCSGGIFTWAAESSVYQNSFDHYQFSQNWEGEGRIVNNVAFSGLGSYRLDSGESLELHSVEGSSFELKPLHRYVFRFYVRTEQGLPRENDLKIRLFAPNVVRALSVQYQPAFNEWTQVEIRFETPILPEVLDQSFAITAYGTTLFVDEFKSIETPTVEFPTAQFSLIANSQENEMQISATALYCPKGKRLEILLSATDRLEIAELFVERVRERPLPTGSFWNSEIASLKGNSLWRLGFLDCRDRDLYISKITPLLLVKFNIVPKAQATSTNYSLDINIIAK